MIDAENLSLDGKPHYVTLVSNVVRHVADSPLVPDPIDEALHTLPGTAIDVSVCEPDWPTAADGAPGRLLVTIELDDHSMWESHQIDQFGEWSDWNQVYPFPV